MGTTYSRVSDRRTTKKTKLPALFRARQGELLGLLASSMVVCFGLFMVYQAKTANPEKTAFDETLTLLKEGQLLDLNAFTRQQDLLSLLTVFSSEADKKFAAEKIADKIIQTGRNLSNIGALTTIRVSRAELDRNPQLESFKQRLAAIRKQEQERLPRIQDAPVALLTETQLRQLKPSFIVRTPEQFQQTFLIWSGLAILCFYLIHLFWRWRSFSGDEMMLPILHLMTGLGLILMVSLRDPLRDNLSFRDFAQGIIAGSILLGAASSIDYHRLYRKYPNLLKWGAIGLGLALSVVLIGLGVGPGNSDAKVNLNLGSLQIQPVEFIKILVIFFLAAYFANNWEFLRELKQKGSGAMSFLQRFNVPRLSYFLPVMIAMGIVLALFFLQKDLGPALVLGFTFLTMYAVARKRSLLIMGGLTMLVVGVWVGYQLALPSTVYQRIRIWLSPWENAMSNGDQIAHGLWAMSTGGATGTGLGLGDPSIIPAGHTDLVIASLGEELGFAGVVAVFALYAVLTARCLRAAKRAESEYLFFLTLGLTLITAFQTILIVSGLLGLLPLSGVVSPFLSLGKSSMIANCILFGIILAVSSRAPDESLIGYFRAPVKWLSVALGAIALVIFSRAGYEQIVRADVNALRPALTRQGDGVYRYQYNPRLMDVARLLPMGSIYDRNGIPLATSKWEELESHRQDYARLGIAIDATCSKLDSRHYPFQGRLFHLLGNVRTRENWGASNTAYVEKEYLGHLRGFDDRPQLEPKTVIELDAQTRRPFTKEVVVLRRDYTELLPLLHYRNRPGQDEAARLLKADRSIRLSIDVRLQLRISELLRQQIETRQEKKGAAVVLDSETGDMLASVSYPFPEDHARAATVNASDDDGEVEERDDLLDRARVGFYPPGSTFKILTAIAALRKAPRLFEKAYECKPLSDGRVGNYVRGMGRPIRDDAGDSAHGSVSMEMGIVASCNAYFAQLGAYDVGADDLLETAKIFEIDAATPNTPDELDKLLPFASYGQGEVLATPFRMARVAATIANNGLMAYGRWVIDEGNKRAQQPQTILPPDLAAQIGRAMRGVVERGTATRLRPINPPISGKTGTAEVEGKDSHSWFIGFAPYGRNQKMAFAVIVENGGYGGRAAAPIAGELVRMTSEILTAR